MTYTRQTLRVIALLCGFALILTLFSPYALAHDGEDHDESTDQETVSEAEVARLEQMVKLLQELVMLLNALKIQQSYAPVVAPIAAINEDAEMDTHHEEHAHTEDAVADTRATEAKLIIEVETHNNQTHVHARYTDKPEEMFFVDASITDEGALIEAIHERTGLTEDAIRAALKYY